MGRNVKWDAQDRGEAQTTVGEAIARHWPATLLGIVWGVLLFMITPKLFWWFSPVLAGFWLAIPMSVWSSRASAGDRAREKGLFLTPEEVHMPKILTDLDTEAEWAGQRVWAKEGDALERVLNDPRVREIHLSLLTNREETKDDLRRHYLEGLELKYQHDGAKGLTPREKRDLLWDKEAIQDLLGASKNGNGNGNVAMAR